MPRFREILSYPDMLQREGIALQKGMNYQVRGGAAGYSIVLMSVRKGAPYQDQWHEESGMLEYEGHDAMQSRHATVRSKEIDQPMSLPSGKLTENGKFYQAAIAAKSGTAEPEVIQVYEKIADGIWCNRGRHLLVDAEIKTVPVAEAGGRAVGGAAKRTRKVFRFFLKPTATPDATTHEDERELSISRQIPTAVKVTVWKRDQGRCVTCGATDNLHFDLDVPFSRGGSSITADNVKLLCARHNLQKSDKILSLGPLLGPLVAASIASMIRGA
jgi:hypothetical protein